MGKKLDKVRQFLWAREKELEFINGRIEAIRPMKKTDGERWWNEYVELKTKQCIAEQDVEWAKNYLAKNGGDNGQVDGKRSQWSV